MMIDENCNPQRLILHL